MLKKKIKAIPKFKNEKEIANSRDVPYQSLMKIFLAERVEKELRESTGR